MKFKLGERASRIQVVPTNHLHAQYSTTGILHEDPITDQDPTISLNVDAIGPRRFLPFKLPVTGPLRRSSQFSNPQLGTSDVITTIVGSLDQNGLARRWKPLQTGFHYDKAVLYGDPLDAVPVVEQKRGIAGVLQKIKRVMQDDIFNADIVVKIAPPEIGRREDRGYTWANLPGNFLRNKTPRRHFFNTMRVIDHGEPIDRAVLVIEGVRNSVDHRTAVAEGLISERRAKRSLDTYIRNNIKSWNLAVPQSLSEQAEFYSMQRNEWGEVSAGIRELMPRLDSRLGATEEGQFHRSQIRYNGRVLPSVEEMFHELEVLYGSTPGNPESAFVINTVFGNLDLNPRNRFSKKKQVFTKGRNKLRKHEIVLDFEMVDLIDPHEANAAAIKFDALDHISQAQLDMGNRERFSIGSEGSVVDLTDLQYTRPGSIGNIMGHSFQRLKKYAKIMRDPLVPERTALYLVGKYLHEASVAEQKLKKKIPAGSASDVVSDAVFIPFVWAAEWMQNYKNFKQEREENEGKQLLRRRESRVA